MALHTDSAPEPCRILAAGELLVEFIASEHGSRHRRVVPYLGPYPSGAPAIFIDQAARLGARTVMVGAVGDDAFGEVILERLTGSGVDCSNVRRRPGETTGTAFVAYETDGSRAFIFHLPHSAATGFGAAPALLDSIATAPPDYLHVSGSILGDESAAPEVVALARAVTAAGGQLSFDPNARPELLDTDTGRARFDELLGLAQILFPSVEDIATLHPGLAIESVLDGFLADGIEHVVLTRGERGCLYRSQDQRHELDSIAVECIDPTGAGDCFSATFLTLFAGGWPAERALRYANAAGALAVTVTGPMEGNSSLADIERQLRQEGIA